MVAVGCPTFEPPNPEQQTRQNLTTNLKDLADYSELGHAQAECASCDSILCFWLGVCTEYRAGILHS